VDNANTQWDSKLQDSVLCLVNSLSFAELDESWGVSLDKRAAQGIIDARPFFDIDTLDQVPYVGKFAFARLSAYSQSHPCDSNVSQEWPNDPFSGSFCQGTASAKDIAESVPLGVANPYNVTFVSTYKVAVRSRECLTNDEASCGAWQPREVWDFFLTPAGQYDAISGMLFITAGAEVAFDFFSKNAAGFNIGHQNYGGKWALSGVGASRLERFNFSFLVNGAGHFNRHFTWQDIYDQRTAVQPHCMAVDVKTRRIPSSKISSGNTEWNIVVFGIW
jgi:hypothetical protein